MRPLTRYWFKFDEIGKPTALNLGCGITAYSYEDAVLLLRERVFPGEGAPRVAACIEDVDVSTLDTKHVLPNLGAVEMRGVWFPIGYER